jgi:hypothetical protein
MKTMNRPLSFVLLVILIAVIACKKDGGVNYSIAGQVTDADDGFTLQGVSVVVEKQVVQNGVYGNSYQNAMSTSTDNQGNYSGTWARENFAALRLLAEKSNYINAESSLNVESFSDGTVTENIQLYKEAFASLRFYHMNGSSSDRLSFTFLNANFDCNCCSNGWQTWQAGNIDTTITCRVYGNRWVKYQVQTLIGTADSSYVDSVFCDAFVTTSRDIQY